MYKLARFFARLLQLVLELDPYVASDGDDVRMRADFVRKRVFNFDVRHSGINDHAVLEVG